MALHRGPNIVTDGLTLCLDAHAPRSYSGSGSVWTDLAQGLEFDSNGTQTPFSTVDGAKCFHFNDSGYWQCTSGYANVDMGGPCTLIMWVYGEGISSRDTIFEKKGTTYQSYQQEIAVTWETSGLLTYYSRYNTYDYAGTSALDTGKWTMMAIKMSTAKTEGVARTGHYSKNGTPWTLNYTSRSTTAVVAAADIRIGYGYAGVVEDGYISKVLVYDKQLTDAEILQNFTADRSRFRI